MCYNKVIQPDFVPRNQTLFFMAKLDEEFRTSIYPQIYCAHREYRRKKSNIQKYNAWENIMRNGHLCTYHVEHSEKKLCKRTANVLKKI